MILFLGKKTSLQQKINIVEDIYKVDIGNNGDAKYMHSKKMN